MPWQRYVADVGCELLEDGTPAYREIMVTVPRQSGKTALFLSWQLDRMLSWGSPQRSVFTAQTGKDARDKWVDEIFPLLDRSQIAPLIEAKIKAMGNESIRFKTGSLIRLLSTSASTGHSKTIDQAVLDEIWHDVDDRREQGIRPAMITRQDAQLLACSTAGTQASTVYNRKVAAGRQAVQEDPGHGMAYFEWSAPDDWDPADDESFYSFHPALGHTIGLDAIRAERSAMESAEFQRAYGNISRSEADMVIPQAAWERATREDAAPSGRVRFGLDVSEDRSAAAIFLFDSDGVGELIEFKQGTGWAPERCNQLVSDHGGVVAVDAGGPAAVLADQIDQAVLLQGRQVLQACAALYDAVVENRVTLRSHPELNAAVEGATRKTVGDQWCWSRKASAADVAPLMAATLAYAAPDNKPRGPTVW